MHPVVRVLLVALALHASVAKAVWAAPQRIVSLDLCTDWMLVRHADRAQVRALSPLHRQYPVAWIDAQWPVHDGTLEQLVSLRPDLVMVGQYNATLLRARLQALGVHRIYGNDGSASWCTVSHPLRFFSHRRDAGVSGNGLNTTGRMAASIWIERG